MKTIEQVTQAYAVLDFIEAHPDKHDQSRWIYSPTAEEIPPGVIGPDEVYAGYDRDRVLNECGTTACYAGWYALLAGRVFSGYGHLLSGGRQDVPRFAAKGLGLTPDEAYALFYDADDLADVRKAVFEIFGPRPDGAA